MDARFMIAGNTKDELRDSFDAAIEQHFFDVTKDTLERMITTLHNLSTAYPPASETHRLLRECRRKAILARDTLLT